MTIVKPSSISVIIPTLNDPSLLEHTVEALESEDDDVEVIIVSGRPSSTPMPPAGKGRVRVIHSAPGRGLQMATGASAASGDTLVFLHDDTRLEPGWRAALTDALADDRVVGGAFRFALDGDRLAYRIIEWGVAWRVRLFHLPYGDQAIFARREAYTAAGGMPLGSFMEDVEFVGRLKRLGRLATANALAVTSARRYERLGILRASIKNWIAASFYFVGVDRQRIQRWYQDQS